MGVKDSSSAFISAIFEVRVIDENETKVNFKPKDLRTLEQLSIYENEPLGSFGGNLMPQSKAENYFVSYIR